MLDLWNMKLRDDFEPFTEGYAVYLYGAMGGARQSFFPHVAFKYYINNGTQPLRAQAAAAVACNRVRVSDLHA